MAKDVNGVLNGLDFGDSVQDNPTPTINPAPIDPKRNYSQYYKPKPRYGSKGGRLGRGSVEKSERKVQFSLTCTSTQKDLFYKAAKNDGRSVSNFVCKAVEEYIKNHEL